MGSLNPVVLLPEALQTRTQQIVSSFALSITTGSGQFCTKPGLFFALAGDGVNSFTNLLHEELEKAVAFPMLSKKIETSYQLNLSKHIEKQKNVETIHISKKENDNAVSSTIACVKGSTFISNPSLHEEIFGPFALIITCENEAEMIACIQSLGGQLTATVHATESELNSFQEVIQCLQDKTGRLVFNGVPTGVEVGYSIHHGGSFPASSSSHFTSVGADAIKRFVRPVCFQSWPNDQLPLELQNQNTTNIWRRVNGELSKSDI